MKKKAMWMLSFLLVLSVLLSAPWVLAQSGGQFHLVRWALTGGGGRSSGGEFTVFGSAGLVEASAGASGGDFAVNGGLWAGATGPLPTPTPTRPSAPGVSPLKLPYLIHQTSR